MKTAIALLMLSAAPAFGAETCYQKADDPTWTATVRQAVEHDIIWKQGEFGTVELTTLSSGTGLERRYAADDDGKTYGFVFVDDDKLVLDLEVYRLGCAK